jgi:CBS domain-containing protein
MKALYVSDREAGSLRTPARRRITGVMSSPVTTISTHAPLADALSVMVAGGLRHLAVVDDAGKCVGVLSDRAIAAAWAADSSCLSYRRVSATVEPMPPLLGQGASVVDAARMMRRYGIDAVAVIDSDGVPVGMVTGSDLVGLLAT